MAVRVADTSLLYILINNFKKIAFFSKIYKDTKYHDPALNGICLTLTSEVRTTNISVLLMTRN
jgi:hypothetical protein